MSNLESLLEDITINKIKNKKSFYNKCNKYKNKNKKIFLFLFLY